MAADVHVPCLHFYIQIAVMEICSNTLNPEFYHDLSHFSKLGVESGRGEHCRGS